MVELLRWLAALPGAVWSVAQAPGWAALAGVVGGVLLVLRLPWALRLSGLPLLLPVLLWQPALPPVGHSKVKTWIGTFWRATESIQTYSLLLRMTQHIHATFKYQMREQPGVQSAEQTLSRGTGSCRDFAYRVSSPVGGLFKSGVFT